MKLLDISFDLGALQKITVTLGCCEQSNFGNLCSSQLMRVGIHAQGRQKQVLVFGIVWKQGNDFAKTGFP